MSQERIDFYRHTLGEAELRNLAQVLDGVFLTAGPRTQEFEKRFADYLGVSQAIGMTSCTTALFLALTALGIGEGDEVIVPAMSFIATANAVIHAGGTPVFVDAELETANLDLDQVEAAITPRTKAIIPVHLYGHMVDMKRLRAIADQHGLAIVEDCAHAVESIRDGVKPGQLGDVACFSFYATKNITCGEGGAIATQREDLAEAIRVIRLHGMSKSAYDRYTATYRHYDMPVMGWKANMNDLQAALLLPQLDRIEAQLERREAICQRYERGFDALGVDYPRVLPGSRSARHLFTIWVEPELRDDVLQGMQEAAVGVAVNYRPIHLMSYYVNRYGFVAGSFPRAEEIGARTVTLPLYPGMSDQQVDQVVERFAAVHRHLVEKRQA